MNAIIGVDRCYSCGLKITEDGYERRDYPGSDSLDDVEFICADCLLQSQDREDDAKHAHPWPRTNATCCNFYQGGPF